MPALHTHTQLHTRTHWRAPPHSHPFKGFPAGRLLFLIWAVFPKLLLFFFSFYFNSSSLTCVTFSPHIIKTDPLGGSSPSLTEAGFVGAFLCRWHTSSESIGALRLLSVSWAYLQNNVTRSPGTGPFSPPQGGFLPLFWAPVLTWAEANPASSHPVFSPHHSRSDANAHLSGLPTSMLLNQVSRKSLSRLQELTCGGGRVHVGGGREGSALMHQASPRRSAFVSSNLTEPFTNASLWKV